MRSLLSLSLALSLGLGLLAACSGSSSGSSPSNGGGSGGGAPKLEVRLGSDTGGGAGGRLSGRLAAVALEDTAGNLTGNLIDSNPEFVLSDPLGATFGLQLARAVVGTFAKVHLAFVPGTLKFSKAQWADKVVTLRAGSLVAALRTPLTIGASGEFRLQLRHLAPVEILPGANNTMHYEPKTTVDVSGPVLLREADVVVGSVDTAAGTVRGTLRSMAGMAVTVSFLKNAVFVIDGDDKSQGDFLAALQSKDVVRVFGLLDDRSTIRAAFAERVDPLENTPGNGKKNKVRGTIAKASGAAVEVDLFEIKIGGRDLPKNRPVTLVVDPSKAKIKYVPRYGKHKGHLGPNALARNQYVEVEWHGAAPNSHVTAHKINIRSDGRLGFLHRLAGEVTAVDTTAHTITLRGSFDFGKETYTSVTVALAASSILVRDTGAAAVELALTDIAVGDTLWLLGRKRAGAKVDATLVVVK